MQTLAIMIFFGNCFMAGHWLSVGITSSLRGKHNEMGISCAFFVLHTVLIIGMLNQ